MQDDDHHHRTPPARLLRDVVESRPVRLFLAALVILSLIPLGSFDVVVRPLCLLCFGAELVARLYLWRQRRLATTPMYAVLFAGADLLAFISFLPLEHWATGSTLQLLALLRLTRLLMLVRFARGLAQDIYSIITRREQLQTLGLVSGAVVVLTFVSAVILSQLAVSTNSDITQEPFRERLWWSFRQLESADNLVPNLAGNPVLIFLSLLLTIAGVFLISFVIGVGANVVDQVVNAERRRDLAYRGHTVVMGNVHDSEELIREFVRIYAKNRQVPAPERLLTWLRYMRPGPRTFPRVALLSRRENAPGFLVEPIMRWVVYRQGDESDPESLQRVAARDAKRAILLTHKDLGHEADAVTISSLAALRAENRDCHVYVEVDESESRDLVEQVGGANTVALDVPRFLGMFLCQHLLMPGIEDLYRDLLTADGTEIYTHIYVDESEQELIARRSADWRFDDLKALAASHGVVLLGVFLGEAPAERNRLGVVRMAGLVRWLNPASEHIPPGVADLGGRPGSIPTRHLRGIIGIAESYLPLRAYADAVAHGQAPPTSTERQAALRPTLVERTSRALVVPKPGPVRVAVVGSSDALPALLEELAQFVTGVDITLFLSGRHDERTPLRTKLERLRLTEDFDGAPPGSTGRVVPLPRGGRVTIFTHDGPDLARFAAHRLGQLDPVEAAVFMCEPEGGDRDARTALRVLRFVRLLEEGVVPHGPSLHLLAEFIAVDKGLHLQRHLDVRKCGFDKEDALRLTLIAKETIKSYFMVHSAFVPGVSGIYSELLEERGQDIVRFVLDADALGEMGDDGDDDEVPFATIAAALRARGATAIAVEHQDGSVSLAPDHLRSFSLRRIRGVYAVAESATLQPATSLKA